MIFFFISAATHYDVDKTAKEKDADMLDATPKTQAKTRNSLTSTAAFTNKNETNEAITSPIPISSKQLTTAQDTTTSQPVSTTKPAAEDTHTTIRGGK